MEVLKCAPTRISTNEVPVVIRSSNPYDSEDPNIPLLPNDKSLL